MVTEPQTTSFTCAELRCDQRTLKTPPPVEILHSHSHHTNLHGTREGLVAIRLQANQALAQPATELCASHAGLGAFWLSQPS